MPGADLPFCQGPLAQGDLPPGRASLGWGAGGRLLVVTGFLGLGAGAGLKDVEAWRGGAPRQCHGGAPCPAKRVRPELRHSEHSGGPGAGSPPPGVSESEGGTPPGLQKHLPGRLACSWPWAEDRTEGHARVCAQLQGLKEGQEPGPSALCRSFPGTSGLKGPHSLLLPFLCLSFLLFF